MAAGDLFTPSAPLTPAQIAERNRRRVAAQTAVEEQRRTEQLRAQAAAREPRPTPRVTAGSVFPGAAEGSIAAQMGAFDPGGMAAAQSQLEPSNLPRIQAAMGASSPWAPLPPQSKDLSRAQMFGNDLALQPLRAAVAPWQLLKAQAGNIYDVAAATGRQLGDLFSPVKEVEAREAARRQPTVAPQEPSAIFSGQQPQAGNAPQAGSAPSPAQMLQGAAPKGGHVAPYSAQYFHNISQFESGGNPNARNPNSTASGLYQFSDPTWISTYRQSYPNLAKNRSDQEILALKSDPHLQNIMIGKLTGANAKALQAAGLSDSSGNLYGAHLLGAPVATRLLSAPDNTPVNQVVKGDAYRFNPILHGKTVGQVKQDFQAVADGTYRAGGGGGGSAAADMMGGDAGTMYNPAYDEQRLEMIRQATGMASKPITAMEVFDPGPEMPQLQQAPHTDWTKADEALAAMRPEEIEDSKKRRMVQGNMWKAAAMALANLPESAGLGKVLAAVGGGLMAGNVTGNEEVDRKMEAFDNKMAAYRGAVFRNEADKASTLARELGNDVEVINKNAMNNYQREKDIWARTHDFKMNADGSVNTTSLSPDGKTVIHKHIPNTAGIIAQGILRQADVLGEMGGRDMSGRLAAVRQQMAVWKMAAAKAAAEGDPSGIIGNAQAMSQIAYKDGRISEVLGPENYKALDDRFNEEAAASNDINLLDRNSPQYKAAHAAYMTRAAASMALSGKDKALEHRLDNVGRAGITQRAATGAIKKATGTKYGASTLMQVDNTLDEDF